MSQQKIENIAAKPQKLVFANEKLKVGNNLFMR